jgi:starvation-inducible DNA-binding protein
MRGEYPLVKLEDFVRNATVKELAAKDFAVKEVLDIVEGDFRLMMELATEIRNEADEANDFVVVAKFEEYVAGYQKNMWFIKAIKA